MRNLSTALASLLVAGALAWPAFAQEPVTPAPGPDPAPATDVDRQDPVDNNVAEDEGFNPGWLGLLGLIGLAGLMPRERRERHTVGTTTATR